jgi:hypothetical protein
MKRLAFVFPNFTDRRRDWGLQVVGLDGADFAGGRQRFQRHALGRCREQ